MKIILLILLPISVLLTACSEGPESPRGFSLPEGNAEAGKAVLISYQCLACHTLQGVSDNDVEQHVPQKVPLGGDVSTIKTYGELVTSVINPSHKIARGFMREGFTDDTGQSLMRNYNDVMTVNELIDLVAFLQPQYNLKPFNRTNYPQYFP
ncbi:MULTISPECIES: c-type cytochrome [unclassified Arsukibacterium]|uniref:c-type cytochrome n=1 Tax=unclassified Arsukibacterium TaxID=2635278 RepID=UPI000C46EB5A|nr:MULTISPECIES: c-type cytochrome [unclassified Arsukibacterium]MAA96224.1 cytochrome C [Rheinheimera sp.]MBM35029.1 cytochrome C [Rheinheimera sp.]HAW92416.1 cytochrome C [Candidatus Azambacteria bacterium]|tara:strand:+ start:26159 stop:26614 length:456 start_codon:yes stop_codon:yes gene_type:complete